MKTFEAMGMAIGRDRVEHAKARRAVKQDLQNALNRRDQRRN